MNSLKELKLRLKYLGLGFILTSLISFSQRDLFFYILLKPLDQILHPKDPSLANPILYLKMTEAFQAQITLSLLMGLLLVLPLFWIQAWFFLSPGLYRKEQKLLLSLIFSSFLFLSLGLVFTKDYLIPRVWSFFLSFSHLEAGSGDSLVSDFSYLPSLIPYLNLSFEIFAAIIMSSQFPIILFLLIHWKWVNEDLLVKRRPFFIIFFLIWGALLSPPDLWSQILIFLPLFSLYEFILLFLFCRRALHKLN